MEIIMAKSTSIHVYLGAETGLLKGINVEKKEWTNLNELDNVNKSNEICTMCWENQLEDSLIFGTRGGLVKTYCTQSQTVKETFKATDSNGDILKGLFKYEQQYVTCTNTGKLCVWQKEGGSYNNNSIIQCGENVYRMRADPCQLTRVGVGGKENDLKIYDIERAEASPVFKAKNVRDDWLDLRVPVWVTDIGYIKRATSSLIVTCTGYHQIRLYDPNTAQRRPMVDMLWEESPLTCLSISNHNDRQIIVGNSIGEQGIIDLRNKRCIGKYKGGAGSVRCIQCHPSKPLVASCGLDRYVRIHDLSSRILTNKFYLKSRLNCLVMASNWDDEEPESTEQTTQESVEVKTEPTENSNDEDDQLWESLDTVAETKTVAKHKVNTRVPSKLDIPRKKKKAIKQKM